MVDTGVDDAHVARLRDLAGNEGHRAFDETEDAGVRLAARAVNELAQHHPRIGAQVEGGAVGEADSELGAVARFNDITLIDDVAELKFLNRTVRVLHRRAAAQALDSADRDCTGGSADLRILSGGFGDREPLDEFGRKSAATGRHQIGTLERSK